MVDVAIWAILVSVGLALVGAIWALTRRGIDRMEVTISDHAERLAALEADNTSNKVELGRLRDMRHDVLDQVSHSLASWYTSITDYINRK